MTQNQNIKVKIWKSSSEMNSEKNWILLIERESWASCAGKKRIEKGSFLGKLQTG